MASEVGNRQQEKETRRAVSKVLSFEIIFDVGLIDTGLFFVISLAFIRFIYFKE